MTSEQRKLAAWFLVPPIVLFVTIVLVPAISVFVLSFTDFDGINAPHFVGIKNYSDLMLKGKTFLMALRNNLFIITVPVFFTLAFAMFLAFSIDRGVKGAKVFRVVFFFPNIIPVAATAIMWTLVYSFGSMGLLNGVIRYGEGVPVLKGVLDFLGVQPSQWLASAALLRTLVPIMVWAGTGSSMLLFLAALSAVSEELYESAKIDGANTWKQFWHITLPSVWDTVVTLFIMGVIGGFKMFDLIWIMENQYPTQETHVINTLLYSAVFHEFKVGKGMAIGVCLFLLVFCVSRISMRLYKKE